MVERTVRILAALLVATAALAAQPLRHEKYRLPNGLTVILHEDHALPVATVNLWYRVGARNEPPGRSGFAHLYEHLMFMGTKRVPGSAFDDLMEAGGGANNASTSLDRTNYFSWGPASLLPTLLWLEADRMEDIGPEMTEEKVRLQCDVVRNEIRQNVENRPYGKAGEQVFQLLYPPAHPYHNAVYGRHEDLEAADAQDVKDFFATFYVPDNGSLVVAGDFDPTAVKSLVERLFGGLPRGRPPESAGAAPVLLPGEVRRTLLDRVELPRIVLSYHAPARFADGDAEAELLADVLADGKASRLYRRLVVKDASAVSVRAVQDGAALGSVFRIEVTATPGKDLAAVEAAVDEELSRLMTEGPAEDEVARVAIAAEASKLARLQSLRARADQLNEYEFHFGEPDSLERDLARYRAATAERVRDVALELLGEKRRVVQWILPEKRPARSSPRDERPAAAPARAFVPPMPEVFTLSNGLEVRLWPRPGLPLVAARLVVHAPPWGPATPVRNPDGSVDPHGKAGLGALLADMTQEGAGERSAAAFAEAVASLGGTLRAQVGHEALTLAMQVLARNFAPAMELLADAALRPRLGEEEFARVKRIQLDELRQRAANPAAVARIVALRHLMGTDNPYGWPVDGTVETVSALSLDDVRALQKEILRPELATLLVAGDVTAAAAKDTLDRCFGAWPAAGARLRPGAEPVHVAGGSSDLFVVDRPGAVQTVIVRAQHGAPYEGPARIPLDLVDTILGGTFTSRLNRNLREVHGYTYGAHSSHEVRPEVGMLIAQTGVRADVTGAALRELLSEFDRMEKGGITEDEVAKARETIRNDAAQSFETLGGLLGQAADLMLCGAGFDRLARDLASMDAWSAGKLDAVAKDRLDPERAGGRVVLVLVGDRTLILDQIKDLDLPPPTFVDPDGNPESDEEPPLPR